MKLLVVESPTKCPKTRKLLHAYEPGQWRVIATAGHWRGLPEMAGQDFLEVVDPGHDFAESFVIHPDKRSIEKQLRDSIRTATEVYIATDDDREGEAIAWHLVEHFRLENARRVRCREITAKGVTSGIRNAGSLNVPLVEAQRARAVVDYLIGMEVSRLIWRFDCRSAGRLQLCFVAGYGVDVLGITQLVTNQLRFRVVPSPFQVVHLSAPTIFLFATTHYSTALCGAIWAAGCAVHTGPVSAAYSR